MEQLPIGLERRLLDAVLMDPVCAVVLERMPTLRLREWWLTAGAVFQNVWNAVEGFPPGGGIKDYDVFYFDDSDLSWEAEDAVIARAAELFTDVPASVEVRNEARVHLWYEAKFGCPAPAYVSAADAMESFASTTCCVGVTQSDGRLLVHAPFGLDDVFAMVMKPNRRLAPKHVYDDKVASYRRRWPSLSAEPW